MSSKMLATVVIFILQECCNAFFEPTLSFPQNIGKYSTFSHFAPANPNIIIHLIGLSYTPGAIIAKRRSDIKKAAGR